MILNHSNIPHIRDGVLTYKKTDPVLPILNKIKGMNWYVQIADTNSFAINTFDLAIPFHIQDSLRHGTINLIIHNSFEGFHEVINNVYKDIVLAKNIPETKIIFISESYNIKNAIETYSQAYCKNPLKCFYLSAVEHSVALQIKNNIDYPYNKELDKTYLSLNRRWRPHRPSLIALLKIKKLLDNGYVSFEYDVEDRNWQNYYGRVLELNSTNDEVFDCLKKNETEICQTKSLLLDTSLQLNDKLPTLYSLENKFYDKTLCSVIAETFYYEQENIGNSIFITEKTYKAIAHLHPFILLSAPHSLKALKERGYKTFENIINEEYDNEVNDATRLLMIVNEIERICNLNEKEKNNFINHCGPICEHNLKILMSRKHLGNCFFAL